ncbi:LuxR family two component transcriptional regulator [Actinomycetospora succinea]|uniref:LuxR family two component transcriptional regulator n=1 Tax=Actinomycetospora succinea TaxID=663603 RepID=A0A4R6VSV9_9PSEU|nr:response regulator transcription factor [Actinomycetospora succinea]TDQ65726.1 LuxR family two component transcriptional regulator [Actinomycetospora succinea]
MGIRVLLVDDQPIVRTGFRTVLTAAGGIDVVGEAGDGPAAVAAVASYRPEVVLMDVRMPGGDGLTATEQITAAYPETRVLVVTTFDVDDYVRRALRGGASGFVLKDSDPEDLVRAVRTVHAGESLLAPSVTTRLVRDWVAQEPVPAPPDGPPEGLTAREHDVLVLVARGLSNAEIAAEMVVAESTVKTHVAHLLRKLERRDRVQLVVHAFECGLVPARGT